MQTDKKLYVPIGVDDFKKLIEEGYYFVDKSLLIREVLSSNAVITLLPRPRRFGKTLNMSMLHYFFEETKESKRHLFNGLKITKYADCMEHQGKYPVIFLTLKDLKDSTWALCYRTMQEVVVSEFSRHDYLLESDALTAVQKKNFAAILDKTADETLYRRALLILSDCLATHHKQPTVILIDEYDSPVHAGYINGYYDEVINFMRGFMGAGLKGNNALKWGILTGILRVSKESIFSDMNNLEVCTFTRQDYSDKFGLLEDEVKTMLELFGLEKKIDIVRSWYNGYQSGPHKVYNPWSIVNLVKNRGILQSYWVNTSSNELIKDLLKESTPQLKEELEVLMTGGRVTKRIRENIIMTNIDQNDDALWNFLLFSGYLTFENYRLVGDTDYAELLIPNIEVGTTYKTTFMEWFSRGKVQQSYDGMLKGLVTGDTEKFKNKFEKFCRESLSYFDIEGGEPERFYHALVLGMLATLAETHDIRSNRESGDGRYDVLVVPHDLTKPGAIIEFKAIDADKKKTLAAGAKEALQQIEDRKYETELRSRGVKTITKLGIAFKGKECLVTVG